MDRLNENGSLDMLAARFPQLAPLKGKLKEALFLLYGCYKNGGKLMVCGNGGSASDSEHIVGELMKSFKLKRPISNDMADKLSSMGAEGKMLSEKLEGALPAIALTGHTALSTAFGNDKDGEMTFAQQLFGYGRRGDILICLTTSGNSKNCVYAALTAKAMGINVISITGEGGGKMSELSDICIPLPERETYLVQELTLPVYHWLCAELEAAFWG